MESIQVIVTESLLGMITSITGLQPPKGTPPDFVQAAIDRAVSRIEGGLVPVAVDRAVALMESRVRALTLPPDCLAVPRWACERLLDPEPSPNRVNAQTVVSELLRGVVPTDPADYDAPRQVRLLLAEVARLRQTASSCASDDIPDFQGSGNKARRRAEGLGIQVARPGLFRHPAPIESEGGHCD